MMAWNIGAPGMTDNGARPGRPMASVGTNTICAAALVAGSGAATNLT